MSDMNRLEPTEEALLREAADPDADTDLAPGWGAAISVALEFLQGSGYLTRSTDAKPTEKGWAYLKQYGFA